MAHLWIIPCRYHFGDVFRLYLRGQFAAHRNAPTINKLWAQCPHLGRDLMRELDAKHQIVKKMAREGKRGYMAYR